MRTLEHLQIFSKEDLSSFTDKRNGETKLGEKLQVLNPAKNISEGLKNSSAKFVLLGIPEDIGVRMNNGKGGANTTWLPVLKAICNIQENEFNIGSNLLVIGHLDFSKEVADFSVKAPLFKTKGNAIVQEIDRELSTLITLIISAGKIPIIIGGGHNNAYGNIKGSAQAFGNPINVVNLDAHTDLRKLEERHSGNGFSYALAQGFLHRYFIFGLHENYTPQYIFDAIRLNPDIQYNTYEELEIYRTKKFSEELEKACNFASKNYFGIEIDLDAVSDFPSSAMSPSGFSTRQARQFVSYFGKQKKAVYLHICEASPTILKEETTVSQIGKFISYLISDFIKGKQNALSIL